MSDLTDRGAALLAALSLTVLIATACLGLVLLASTEGLVAANHRAGVEARLAAYAVANRALDDLQYVPSWDDVVAGRVRSVFLDVNPAPRDARGAAVDVSLLTRDEQRQSDLEARRGADNPRWTLFASGFLADLLPGRPVGSSYVMAWVADDPADDDGDPTTDANRIVQLRGLAIGPGSATGRVAVTLGLVTDAPPGSRKGIRVLSWRTVS